jgi:dCMP deaminase
MVNLYKTVCPVRPTARATWDEYHMVQARAASIRSEDPSSRVGCVIVDQDNRIISTGYNGFIAGCGKHGVCFDRPMKYNLVIHAEMNALMFARCNLKGAKLYCTHAPCDNCLKHILQAGIRWVMFGKTDPLYRIPDDALRACQLLVKSVQHELKMMHNTEGIWYPNIIDDMLEERKR